jgi:hypothetical protein
MWGNKTLLVKFGSICDEDFRYHDEMTGILDIEPTITKALNTAQQMQQSGSADEEIRKQMENLKLSPDDVDQIMQKLRTVSLKPPMR